MTLAEAALLREGVGMQASLSIAVALGLSLVAASAPPTTATGRVQRQHVRHVRADKTIVPAPMQVDTSAHPRVDMPPGMQGIPTNTDHLPGLTTKGR